MLWLWSKALPSFTWIPAGASPGCRYLLLTSQDPFSVQQSEWPFWNISQRVILLCSKSCSGSLLHSQCPTHEPSSCKLSKMWTCILPTSGLGEMAAWLLCSLANDPSPLPSPPSSAFSSLTLLACLFDAGCCMPAAVLYYCTFKVLYVRLEMFYLLILVDWWLVYNIGLISVIHQYELTIGVHMSSAS